VALQTPSRHLTDPSLTASLLGAGSQRLLVEPKTPGFLFESQVIHDLHVYVQVYPQRACAKPLDEVRSGCGTVAP
jgi:hypothetical protein